MGRHRETFWYAVRVFREKARFLEDFRTAQLDTFIPYQVIEQYENGQLSYKAMPLMPSLVFVRCTEKFLLRYKFEHNDRFTWYRGADTTGPGRIDDHEMEVFKLVTTLKDPNVRYFGEELPGIQKGDRVRVTEGLYKGAEGYVRRIGSRRRLLVSITGVAVVVITNIDLQYLEKI